MRDFINIIPYLFTVHNKHVYSSYDFLISQRTGWCRFSIMFSTRKFLNTFNIPNTLVSVQDWYIPQHLYVLYQQPLNVQAVLVYIPLTCKFYAHRNSTSGIRSIIWYVFPAKQKYVKFLGSKIAINNFKLK